MEEYNLDGSVQIILGTSAGYIGLESQGFGLFKRILKLSYSSVFVLVTSVEQI